MIFYLCQSQQSKYKFTSWNILTKINTKHFLQISVFLYSHCWESAHFPEFQISATQKRGNQYGACSFSFAWTQSFYYVNFGMHFVFDIHSARFVKEQQAYHTAICLLNAFLKVCLLLLLNKLSIWNLKLRWPGNNMLSNLHVQKYKG